MQVHAQVQEAMQPQLVTSPRGKVDDTSILVKDYLSSVSTDVLGLIHGFVGQNNVYSKTKLPQYIVKANHKHKVRCAINHGFIRVVKRVVPYVNGHDVPYSHLVDYETLSGIKTSVTHTQNTLDITKGDYIIEMEGDEDDDLIDFN